MAKLSENYRSLVKPNGPVCGEIRVGGCKSISHRALLLGLLAQSKSKILGLSECQDVQNTLNIVQLLSANYEDGLLTGAKRLSESGIFDCGNSGTSARLLSGLLASHNGSWQITGDASLCKRPMRAVIEPLELAGANFSNNKLPLTIRGNYNLTPLNYNIPQASAQTKSTLMLASLNIDGICKITEPLATRDHTENLFHEFGIGFQKSGLTIETKGKQQFHGTQIHIGGDPSSAAFIATIALLVPNSEIILNDINLNPTRLGFFETISQMGGNIKYHNVRLVNSEPIGDIIVKHSYLKAIEIPAGQIPAMIDEIPLLALLASQAAGITKISGLEALRFKESNRLQIIYDNLRKLGASIEIEGDNLIIEGRAALGATETFIDAQKDHRIIMTFLIAGLTTKKPIWCKDLEMVGTSFPEFWQILKQLGISYE